MIVRKSSRWLRTLVAAIIAGVFAYNVSAQDLTLYGFDPETRIYIVQPGDTLWGISERAYEDPWKWPRIWENNPEVDNPHEIYPDGRLVMPFTDGSAPVSPPVMPEPEPEPVTVAEAPEPEPEPEVVEPEEQDGAEILTDYGEEAEASRINIQAKPDVRRGEARYIVLRIGPEGLFTSEENRENIAILGGHDERKIFSRHDVVFLSRGENSGLKSGQRFYTYEKREGIEHPETGEDLGAYLRTTGVLEVEKVSRRSSTARVIESFDSIETSNYLTEYREFEQEVFPQYNDETREGIILATLEDLKVVATNQVMYTDLGARDGLKLGAMVNISRKQITRYDRINDEDVPLPNIELGLGVVVDVSDKTSTVLIVRANDAIHIGDTIRTVVDDG